MKWRDVKNDPPPKGGGASKVNDTNWKEPPRVLLLYGVVATVGYWDWYYAVGGNGCNGMSAWISQDSGEQLDLLYDSLTHWMPLPALPK